MPRLVHFEIHADDPARAQVFYASVFGWQFQQWDAQEYWMIITGADDEPGINGGLMRRRGQPPANGAAVNAFVCTMMVPNLDEYLEKAKNAGGMVVVEKSAIAGAGWLAYCKDTEGNIIGMMQEDATAQ